MKIGLIDVDSHHYPNLALMKISAYHKSRGDSVEWWWGFGQYDRVYMSKVFDETYTPDMDEPLNAREIVKGGTGYGLDNRLPEEILARQKQWQKEHREKLNAYSREYRKRRKEKGGYEKTDGCLGKVGGAT